VHPIDLLDASYAVLSRQQPDQIAHAPLDSAVGADG
jgi:hypothetical protein